MQAEHKDAPAVKNTRNFNSAAASVAEAWPWRILLITLFASTLSNMDQSLFGYAVPAVMRHLDISLEAVGLIISASFASAAVSAPVFSAGVPRFGAPLILAASVAASAAFVGLLSFISAPWLFAAVRITGFGLSAAIIPVSSAYLAIHSPTRGRALLIAIQQCGYPLGWFIASTFAASLMQVHGWRAPFYVAFAVIPLAWLVYHLLPRYHRSDATPTSDSTRERSSLRQLFAGPMRRTTLTFSAAFFLYGGAVGGTSFYLPTFFEQARGYSAASSTHIVGLSYAIGMLGYVGAATVSDLWLSRATTLTLWLLAATGGLIAAIWLPHTVPEDTLAFGLTAIFYYGTSSIMVTCLLERYPQSLCAAAASVAGTACISLGFVVFPLVTAATVKMIGWQPAFSIIMVPAVLISALLVSSLPRAGKESVFAAENA